jgi:hypothetical protein
VVGNRGVFRTTRINAEASFAAWVALAHDHSPLTGIASALSTTYK